MKSILLFIVLSSVFHPTYSQVNSEIERTDSVNKIGVELIDPIYFILGTLSDYMGRFQYVDRKRQVDRYYPAEKPLVDYLTSYIKTELNIEVDTVFEKSNHSEMFSDELSKTLNSFYGEKDELITSKFETKKQIYSFLAGVYYRYGEKLDTSIYKIQLANSPKHLNCYELLKRIGCEKIFYKYLRNIPAQFIIYFEPTDELKNYLEIIEPYSIILKKSHFDQMVEMMKGHITKKELEKDLHKSSDKELENIKNAFKQ